MKITVTYLCNHSKGSNQRGTIKVETPTGIIDGTWRVSGGRGSGSELVANTSEFTDEVAHEILNASGLCQGYGTFTCELTFDQYGWADITDVQWPAEATQS